ncbi:hypothetical protein TWF718_001513 [Orbilia javanica]|uniref:Uncharacterized protein n=1 Tax=Orbilia javanica TaxID=47235 RepID=A0AAN8NDY8_9PEZI
MDRKAQRIENIRMHLRNLIYEQHGEQVDPKEITNTHRSRAPFQFVFKSDDPKQPKVSIASISQPDYDAIMRLIMAGRLRATRTDESLNFFGLKQEPDGASQPSPTETFETSSITTSPTGSVGRISFKRESPNVEEITTGGAQIARSPLASVPGSPPKLPSFNTMMNLGGALEFSPPSHPAHLPPLSRPQNMNNFIPVTSHQMSTAMAIDDPPRSLGTAYWDRIHKDVEELRLGAFQWAEELGEIKASVEELSKLQRRKEDSEMVYSEIEELKSENTALKLRVEALEEEKRIITNERDILKRLQDGIS